MNWFQSHWCLFFSSMWTGNSDDWRTESYKLTLTFDLHPQAHAHQIHGAGVQNAAETLELQNQVQSLLPDPPGLQRRWSHPQHRSVGVLPQPEPEEETKPFILDLKSFPDLTNADINAQNPNIQVSSGTRGGQYKRKFEIKSQIMSWKVSDMR